MHYIQSYILDKLIVVESLRNKDMRPPGVESNLYQYHLLRLQKEGYIKKQNGRYSLACKGLAYAGRHSIYLKKQRPQPQVNNILFVSDSNNALFLRTKLRQPFIGMKSLVTGKIHLNESIDEAIDREFAERVCSCRKEAEFEKFGTAHIIVRRNNFVITDYIALLVSVKLMAGYRLNPNGEFYKLSEIKTLNLAPGVNELIEAYKNRSVFTESIIDYKDDVKW